MERSQISISRAGDLGAEREMELWLIEEVSVNEVQSYRRGEGEGGGEGGRDGEM